MAARRDGHGTRVELGEAGAAARVGRIELP
jgi:hypothetical protein